MKKLFAPLTCLFLALVAVQAGPCLSPAFGAGQKEPVIIRSVHGDFDSVWEDLNTALGDRGLVVSSVSHVGEMLERTGKALGRTRKIFGKAKVVEFCSAVVSRDMMETDPHFIAFCPYQIAVYTIQGEEKKVYLSYRRLIWNDKSGQAARKEVEDLLDGIVTDVINMQTE
ncbi:MAG: DUF302 domain-containing protein [Nitrospiraceae bacterium]|nr:DUF302 domain-containing protein [Nitrospiraceae bacterium]